MTYNDLPEPRKGVKFIDGGQIEARQPVLLCRGRCFTIFSADPSNYSTRLSDEKILCSECGEPLILAEVRPNTYIPYEQEPALSAFIAHLWATFEAGMLDTDEDRS